ncbi:MAG: xanthan lyase [Bacteroidales bacterium]|nr:xanthan lyase [Bacteroidales bacterium]
MKKLSVIICAIIISSWSSFAQKPENYFPAPTLSDKFMPITDSIQHYISKHASVLGIIQIDTVIVRNNKLEISFKRSLSEYSLKEKDISNIYSITKLLLPTEYDKYKNKFTIHTAGQILEEFQSDYYSGIPIKKDKKAKYDADPEKQLVRDVSKPFKIEKGLQGRHIAMWQSHGYYYDKGLKRWEWQRARIFETVEDLYTQSYVLPFLVPMLENAGATILLPRERDVQVNEVIVDNDDYFSGFYLKGNEICWTKTEKPGFANKQSVYQYGENPFVMGSAIFTKTRKDKDKRTKESVACWIPNIPQKGEYAVYVSYQTIHNSSSAAKYTVKHMGGSTQFEVNQKMGGSTWVYLGTFLFEDGQNKDQGVFLSNSGRNSREYVSADAVKFGGGIGNIASKPAEIDPEGNPIAVDFHVEAETSGYPRFTEGSRYWLQWAGFNDTIYSHNRNMNDYTDDYQSRAKWVNILSDGSYLKPKKEGYNIPIDLSFAFHSDAGTTLTDSIIGTLAIYTRMSNNSTLYPDGRDRIVARELTDIVQSQIVADIQSIYEPEWKRRGLWDRSYYESRVPEVPAMLLELLSHQNFADMRYGLDPTFRFTVSRAIYKGMVKFIAYTNGFNYMIQPLPVNSFSAVTTLDNEKKNVVCLSWRPTTDPLEASAVAEKFILYTRINDGGFDNGVVINADNVQIRIFPNKIYSFKVTAANQGGESFPSEILSVGISSKSDKTVLIINGFDRISAPASYATKDSTMAGFESNIDGGVPYIKDISFIGKQHEFRRKIPWMDDDAPGFGASYANYETKVISGNTFDYPYIHGEAFMKAGYSFVSSSRDAVCAGSVNMNNYTMVDIIFGKQIKTQVGREGASPLKYEVFPFELQKHITNYCENGGNLLISGANIASDVWDKIYNYTQDSTMMAEVILPTQMFVKKVLKYKWMTNYASMTAEVKAIQNPLGIKGNYSYVNYLNEKKYCVETPDALVPVGKNAFTIFRYADNDISAGVAYCGKYRVVSLGFPIEVLRSQEQIDALINEIVTFFNNKNIKSENEADPILKNVKSSDN